MASNFLDDNDDEFASQLENLIQCDNFLFKFHHHCHQGKFTWRCTKTELKFLARLTTYGLILVKNKVTILHECHNHAPDVNKLNLLEHQRKIKVKATVSDEP